MVDAIHTPRHVHHVNQLPEDNDDVHEHGSDFVEFTLSSVQLHPLRTTSIYDFENTQMAVGGYIQCIHHHQNNHHHNIDNPGNSRQFNILVGFVLHAVFLEGSTKVECCATKASVVRQKLVLRARQKLVLRDDKS